MAKINQRFSKLTRAQFDQQLSTGGGFEKYCIVFISDEKQIWHDGIFYGVSDEQAQKIVMYQSALPDELTTPSKHGGLAAGTKVSDLKKKTLSQVFDDILFEEIQPTVQNPSCSITPKGSWSNNGIYEVGAAAPSSATDFNVSFNRGNCTVVGQPTKYRAGAETGRDIKLGASALSEGSKITLGTMTYNLTVNHGEGDTLLTSKGNKATNARPNPLGAGSVKSSCNIYGTYPYFCNGASASSSAQDSNLPSSVTPNTKLPLIKWTDALIGAKFASEASTGTRLEFHFPSEKNVTKVEFFNTVSGKWEVFASANYVISEAGNKQIQSVDVPYKKLTTQGSLSGALQLRFTLANATRLMSNEPYTYNGEEITDATFRALAMNSSTVPFMAMNDAPVTLAAATGNRPAGVANFAVNFEPGGQAPLDARSLVPTKADLINAATYSAKNYYKGMLVVVADDGGKPALYVLKDTAKLTSADYSGWQRVDVGGQSIIQIVNDLTTGGTNKALSAEQGKVLKSLIDSVNGKLTGVDTNVGDLIDEKVKVAKDAIDAYTINGKKINTNPVLVKDDVGLSKVSNDAQVKRSEMGVAGGVATLGTDGKVPTTQLPSYVDDVVEFVKTYANKAAIPTSGLVEGSLHYAIAEKLMFKATNATTLDVGTKPEAGKIYIAVSDNNKQYRWGGDSSGLVQITSGNLVLGETQGTAYEGSKGKANADAIAALKNNTVNGIKISADPVLTGDNVMMTGFTALGEDQTTEDQLTPKPTDKINIGIAKLHRAILNNEEVVSKAYNAINNSLGFSENGEYQPTSIELQSKTVTEAIDIIFAKAKAYDTLKAELDAFKAEFNWYEGE